VPLFVVGDEGWVDEGYASTAAVWRGLEEFVPLVARASESGRAPLILIEAVLPLTPDPFDVFVVRDQVACFDPTLMLVRDGQGNARFPEMSVPFDGEWSDRVSRAARDEGLRTAEGVIVGVSEPGLLTPAERAALAGLGGHAACRWIHLGVRRARADEVPVVGVGIAPGVKAGTVPLLLAAVAGATRGGAAG